MILLNPLLLTVALAASSALASPRGPPPGFAAHTNSKRRTAKYFNEAGGTLALSHYDARFYSGEVAYDEHRFVLRDLIRSYLTVLPSQYGVETWIAHGTLLGWWWNGQIMPWDYDLDVQVTSATMQWLADNLNGTSHEHSFVSAGAVVTKTYLLDVNPHHSDLDRGDGMNIIDARWIDTHNGMFIDITALREREPSRPGFWSCKNKHRYASQDLWPMRVSEFEGVPARIPYGFEKILVDEYGTGSLVVEEFEQHRFDHDIKEWVKMSEEEAEKSKAAATERKKQELIKQGRLTESP